MDMLLKLLELSRDYLIITDGVGNCLKIGDHFQNALTKHKVGKDELSDKDLEQLYMKYMAGYMEEAA